MVRAQHIVGQGVPHRGEGFANVGGSGAVIHDGRVEVGEREASGCVAGCHLPPLDGGIEEGIGCPRPLFGRIQPVTAIPDSARWLARYPPLKPRAPVTSARVTDVSRMCRSSRPKAGIFLFNRPPPPLVVAIPRTVSFNPSSNVTCGCHPSFLSWLYQDCTEDRGPGDPARA